MEGEGSQLSPRRPRTDCLIHCTEDDSKLVSPQNLDSWQSLLSAAEIRNHDYFEHHKGPARGGNPISAIPSKMPQQIYP